MQMSCRMVENPFVVEMAVFSFFVLFVLFWGSKVFGDLESKLLRGDEGVQAAQVVERGRGEVEEEEEGEVGEVEIEEEGEGEEQRTAIREALGLLFVLFSACFHAGEAISSLQGGGRRVRKRGETAV